MRPRVPVNALFSVKRRRYGSMAYYRRCRRRRMNDICNDSIGGDISDCINGYFTETRRINTLKQPPSLNAK